MRRLLATGQKDNDIDINVTPMLDVIFIMLIFFIVTASFIKTPGIEVNSAKASSAKLQERVNILIAITANNEIWIDKQQVNDSELRSKIARLRAENPLGSVIIQPDREARAEALVNVMDAAQLAGVKNVAIAAELK